MYKNDVKKMWSLHLKKMKWQDKMMLEEFRKREIVEATKKALEAEVIKTLKDNGIKINDEYLLIVTFSFGESIMVIGVQELNWVISNFKDLTAKDRNKIKELLEKRIHELTEHGNISIYI